jgi:hypothetical protein
MIDEMTCAFDSPGSMSALLIIVIVLLFRDPTNRARGRSRASNNGIVPRGCFVRCGVRSELVGCGVRPVHDGCRLAQHTESKLNAKWRIVKTCPEQTCPSARNAECRDTLPSIRHLCPDVGAAWAERQGAWAQAPCKRMKRNTGESRAGLSMIWHVNCDQAHAIQQAPVLDSIVSVLDS